jgi:cyclic pyranopterin monophosphate synthase
MRSQKRGVRGRKPKRATSNEKRTSNSLSHLDSCGRAAMVHVGDKPVTERRATARATVRLPRICRDVLAAGGETKKGNVFAVARLAGIAAAKRTDELIPLCHQIPLDDVSVNLALNKNRIVIDAVARCHAKTGVEMEALTAASVAALTVYDMLKGLSHDIVIESIELLRKSGGRSGEIVRT